MNHRSCLQRHLEAILLFKTLIMFSACFKLKETDSVWPWPETILQSVYWMYVNVAIVSGFFSRISPSFPWHSSFIQGCVCCVHRSTQSPRCHFTDTILPHNTRSLLLLSSMCQEQGRHQHLTFDFDLDKMFLFGSLKHFIYFMLFDDK